MIRGICPAKNAVVDLETDYQKRFARDEIKRQKLDGSRIFTCYDPELKGLDMTHPMPVVFSWEDTDLGQKEIGCSFLLVSEYEDLRDPWVYMTKDFSYSVYNLKVGTTYYWCVQKNGKRSEVASFQTAETLPRCLKIDGASNLRDIGGCVTPQGRIRQGLLYRGSEFELHMHLQPDGAEELKRLKIRTEIDLREEARDTVDFTVGELIGMRRAFLPIDAYASFFDREYRNSLKGIFKLLANPQNYPIYFHCWGGADRTGTLAFVIGALLGMPYEKLIYEYEFTSLSVFGIRTRNYSEFCAFIEKFMALEGDSLSDKAYAFLRKQVGVTDKQIASIKGILLDTQRSENR